jgi:hypothetical protein
MSRSVFLFFIIYLPSVGPPPSFLRDVVFRVHCMVGPSSSLRGHSGAQATSLVLDVGCYFRGMAWHITKGIVMHFMLFQ